MKEMIIVEELEKLAQLKEKGIITEEQFAQKKAQILDIMPKKQQCQFFKKPIRFFYFGLSIFTILTIILLILPVITGDNSCFSIIYDTEQYQSTSSSNPNCAICTVEIIDNTPNTIICIVSFVSLCISILLWIFYIVMLINRRIHK